LFIVGLLPIADYLGRRSGQSALSEKNLSA